MTVREDLSDLPPEVLRELSRRLPQQLGSQILSLFETEPVDIDNIIIGLFRRYGVTMKRRILMNKLHRMKTAGLIRTVPGARGLYTKVEGNT